MKKYVKPDVLFEDFEMSVGVAACTNLIFSPDGSLKYFDENDPGNQIMMQDGLFGSSCSKPITKDNVYDYYGRTEGEIFGS